MTQRAKRPGGGIGQAAQALSRRSDIASFIVMDVMRAAAAKEAAGAHVIHMEVGQPATPAPRTAIQRVKAALDTDNLGYTLALGMPELRERIAAAYAERYGVTISPERVVVTSGSSAAFVLAFLALFDAGAKVALASPGYPCYRHILTALGLEPVIIETDETTRWMPSIQQIEAAAGNGGLDGLLIASPANPTGTMIEPARLAQIMSVCERHKVRFISDEIYHGLSYGAAAETALAHSQDAVVINSFSKYFSMTGWRVGWMVVPLAMVRAMEKLTQNLYIAAPAVSQVAALGAFDGIEELEANKQVYAANRELLLNELPKAGFDRIVPADGAFYLYADISIYSDDALAFAQRMLEQTGVAATPGLDFDERRGGRFIRFSYAGSTDDMAEAARRLQGWSGLKSPC